jgi:hypothetical protein
MNYTHGFDEHSGLWEVKRDGERVSLHTTEAQAVAHVEARRVADDVDRSANE